MGYCTRLYSVLRISAFCRLLFCFQILLNVAQSFSLVSKFIGPSFFVFAIRVAIFLVEFLHGAFFNWQEVWRHRDQACYGRGILIDAHSTPKSRIALIIKKADEDIHQLFF